MAKVRGPLMSFSAKGNFGNGALNFQQSGQETVVRHLRESIKKDPSAKQAAARANVKYCVSVWRYLHFIDREHWGKIDGDPRGYRLQYPYYTPRTGYHLYLRRNLTYLLDGTGLILSPFSEMRASPEAAISITNDMIL